MCYWHNIFRTTITMHYNNTIESRFRHTTHIGYWTIPVIELKKFSI